MRAYNFCMLIIYINIGFAVVASLNVFGSEIESHTTGIISLSETILTAKFTIPLIGVDVTAPMVLAGLMVTGSILVYNTTPGPQPSGVAIGAFAIVFWGSLTSTGIIIGSFTDDFPATGMFYAIFLLVSTLMFLMALIQMGSGGHKSHV